MKKILLVLLFAFSLFAGENGEIGKPYFNMQEKSSIDSAVLASDGNSFYTIKDGLISLYQLNPLKKVYSFQTSIVSDNYNIYVTSDNQKMIIASNKELILLDLKTQTIMNRIKYENRLRVMNDMNLITINNDKVMIVWDIQQFNKIKEISLYDACQEVECSDGYHYFPDNANALYKVNNRLVYISNHSVAIFDATNLQIIKKIHKSERDEVRLGIDNKVIYFSEQAVNINTGNNVVSKNKSIKITQSAYYRLENMSIVQDIKLISRRDVVGLLIEKGNYELHQYKDGDLVINHYDKFEATSPEVKKYLKMETKDRNIIPINDVTFKKYNTEINLKD